MLNNAIAEQLQLYKVDHPTKCRNSSSAIRCAPSSVVCNFISQVNADSNCMWGGRGGREWYGCEEATKTPVEGISLAKRKNSGATKANKMKIVSGNWNWVHVTTIGEDIPTIPIPSLFKCKRCDTQRSFSVQRLSWFSLEWSEYFRCCCR